MKDVTLTSSLLLQHPYSTYSKPTVPTSYSTTAVHQQSLPLSALALLELFSFTRIYICSISPTAPPVSDCSLSFIHTHGQHLKNNSGSHRTVFLYSTFQVYIHNTVTQQLLSKMLWSMRFSWCFQRQYVRSQRRCLKYDLWTDYSNGRQLEEMIARYCDHVQGPFPVPPCHTSKFDTVV